MPLPKPEPGESQNDFMGRCVVDPNIVNDFDTIDQRVAVCSNLYNPPKEEKAQDNWADQFEKQLSKAERTSIRDFTEFYRAEYNDAIDQFLKSQSMTTATAQAFFQDSKYVAMYEGMYSKIGLQFANWYSKNVEKYMPKADAGNMQSIWANAFAFMGNQVGTQSAIMVSSTAQATLTNTIRQFMSDPIFMSAGEKVQAKMLRQRFDYLADYQARRIVRTEATNAANYATEQAALNLFPGADMTKTWKSGYDARVRDAHRAANGQVVPFNSKFSVGGESLQRPGDPSASASNRINCRCSMIVLPKAGAQTIGPRITNIGFGMAQADVVDAISSAMLAPEVIATVVAETAVVEAQAQKELMRPDNWNEVVPKGVQINDDYLELLKNTPNFKSNTKGSFYSSLTNTIEIDIKRHNAETISKVLAHEFGHAIHFQQGWVTFTKLDSSIELLMKNQLESIYGKAKGIERAKIINSYNNKFWPDPELRAKFPQLSDKAYGEMIAATADYFGALTKNQIGWGHTNSYYKGTYGKNVQAMEMIAHAFENKYVGNPVFKELFPVEYEQSIKLLDDLILKSKK
jgi:hypothetical protein